tara:strand:- start:3571 stop:4239 length:669 start_codon:yes stop_codon:yes gene_type:complete
VKDIPLNDEVLEILNESLWFLEDENYKSTPLQCSNQITKADKWTNDEYFNKIKDMGKTHNGFPECCCNHSLSMPVKFSDTATINQINKVTEIRNSFLTKIQSFYNLKRNALWAMYPPGGFISWHNNANASAYNFIFTYSETGEGFWKHWDMEKGEFVIIQDKKGWQCKAGYFGAYVESPSKLKYHMARNTSETGMRMTIAFVLDRSDLSEGLQDWVIEDIHK